MKEEGVGMIKRLIVLMIALAMVFAVTSCGKADQPEESNIEPEPKPEEAVSGGWEMAENEAATLPEDVQTAFDKALEKFTGSELKPVAYVASQVVAGMNHMILCEETTTTESQVSSYKMVIIYADLEGNAEITGIKDFELTSYVEGDGADANSEALAGGWSVPEKGSETSIPDDAKEVFDKASETLDGNELEPMALLGTQLVAGTNYAFICRSTLTTKEPVHSVQVVTIYADLEGNAEINNIYTLDPADFNE